MKLMEIINVLKNEDRVIIETTERKYIGYREFLLEGELEKTGLTGEENVKAVRAVPEIRHRRWKEMGYDSPLEPKQTPMYSFSDLQLQLYYKIII